jgi:hypothetical protein
MPVNDVKIDLASLLSSFIQLIKNENGIVTKLVIHQNGKFIECKKKLTHFICYN